MQPFRFRALLLTFIFIAHAAHADNIEPTIELNLDVLNTLGAAPAPAPEMPAESSDPTNMVWVKGPEGKVVADETRKRPAEQPGYAKKKPKPVKPKPAKPIEKKVEPAAPPVETPPPAPEPKPEVKPEVKVEQPPAPPPPPPVEAPLPEPEKPIEGPITLPVPPPPPVEPLAPIPEPVAEEPKEAPKPGLPPLPPVPATPVIEPPKPEPDKAAELPPPAEAPIVTVTPAIEPPPPPPPPPPSVAEEKPPAPVEIKPAEPVAPEPEKPAAVPTSSADLSIAFKVTETTVPLTTKDALDTLAKKLKADSSLRANVLAYASGTEDQASAARRVSLARALSVRAYLIEQGVDKAALNVQAEGNKNPGGEPDRVDIVVVKGER